MVFTLDFTSWYIISASRMSNCLHLFFHHPTAAGSVFLYFISSGAVPRRQASSCSLGNYECLNFMHFAQETIN